MPKFVQSQNEPLAVLKSLQVKIQLFSCEDDLESILQTNITNYLRVSK